jgi:hypothetical protein
VSIDSVDSLNVCSKEASNMSGNMMLARLCQKVWETQRCSETDEDFFSSKRRNFKTLCMFTEVLYLILSNDMNHTAVLIL